MEFSMFCVYLTSYSGNKLPPFYIGSSSVANVLAGYRGSVSSRKFKAMWKEELNNNPQHFKTMVLCSFETKQEALEKEKKLQFLLKVVRNELYVNQALACPNGFFGRDVSGKNNPRFGVKVSDISKCKMSKSATGKMQTPRHNENISKAQLLLWESEERRNTLSIKYSGAGNPNFGKIGEASPNFGKTRSSTTKTRISKALKEHLRTDSHCVKLSRMYLIERTDGRTFSGYGLGKFCATISVKQTSFLYSLTSKKFMNGFRLIAKLGMCNDLGAISLSDHLTLN